MHIRKILTVVLIAASLSAVADFRTITRAYEIRLSNLRVPVTSTGSLIFKQCDDCENIVALMTNRTQFIVNGKTVNIRDFRKNVFQVRDRRHEPVIIKHHLETDTITSIRVDLATTAD
jgi:hypothetical protein